MLTATRYTRRTISPLESPYSGSHLPRPRRQGLVRRFGLVALSALAIAAGAGVVVESASATAYSTAGGGTCRAYGSTVTVATGPAQFSAQRTTLVKKWVRLVDYFSGYTQTDWSYAGYAWSSPGYPASFGPAALSEANPNTRSRIQAYYAFYINGVLVNDLVVRTTSYMGSVYFSGLGWQPSGLQAAC